MRVKSVTITVFLSVLIVVKIAHALLKDDVKKGNTLYNNKKYNEAIKSYESALTNHPDSGIANLNYGAALRE